MWWPPIRSLLVSSHRVCFLARAPRLACTVSAPRTVQVTVVPVESSWDYKSITTHELLKPGTIGGLANGSRHAVMVEVADGELWWEAHATLYPVVSRGAGVSSSHILERCPARGSPLCLFPCGWKGCKAQWRVRIAGAHGHRPVRSADALRARGAVRPPRQDRAQRRPAWPRPQLPVPPNIRAWTHACGRRGAASCQTVRFLPLAVAARPCAERPPPALRITPFRFAHHPLPLCASLPV